MSKSVLACVFLGISGSLYIVCCEKNVGTAEEDVCIYEVGSGFP